MDKLYTLGEIYIINHSRKGTFTIRVESEDAEWVTGEIVSGQPRFMSQDSYAYAEKGESITLRKCFITNPPKKTKPDKDAKASAARQDFERACPEAASYIAAIDGAV